MTDFATLSADFESHPITGYLPDGRKLNVPLVSHIVDNLYVGGCINGVDLGDFFSHVFSLYKWERYRFGDATKLYEYTMYDDPNKVELQDANENFLDISEVADKIVAALEAGGNVLVHCQAGINRSNLTAALVLMKWKGMDAGEAIYTLRKRRSDMVLANRGFCRYLNNFNTPAIESVGQEF